MSRLPDYLGVHVCDVDPVSVHMNTCARMYICMYMYNTYTLHYVHEISYMYVQVGHLRLYVERVC